MDEQINQKEAEPEQEQALRAHVEEIEARLLRLQADMDNMRRRHQREKEELWDVVAANCICQLLPAVDNFDRAVKVLPEGDWTHGMVMVHKQLQEILHRLGLEPIEATGVFDPQIHEAIALDSESPAPENTITAELERGYKFKGKPLRPSKVRVSMGGKNCE